MTKPSDDEGLHIVPDDKPRPRLYQEQIPEVVPRAGDAPSPERSSLFSARRVAIAVGVALAVITIASGIAYWMERHRYPVVVAISPPNSKASPNSVSATSEPLVPVRPDMLQVTSIALGEPNLAIVNGKSLSEGEWLRVKTALGAANLRVISIQDGFVRFRHGGQIIDARLQIAKSAEH